MLPPRSSPKQSLLRQNGVGNLRIIPSFHSDTTMDQHHHHHAETSGFEPMRLNAMKLLVLAILLGSTFGVLYFAPQLDAWWGEGTAYRYAASCLPLLYVVLVVVYALYMRMRPAKDVQ